MGLGIFWGNAATATDQSLKEWKQLWLQEEEQKKTEELERTRQQLERDKMAQDERLRQMAEQGADNRAVQAFQFQNQQNLLDNFNKTDNPLVRQDMYASAAASGVDPLILGQMKSGLREGVVTNVTSASDILNAVLNPPTSGYKSQTWLVEDAARMVGATMGKTGKDLNDFISYWGNAATEANTEGQEARDRSVDREVSELDDLRTQTQERQANIAQSQAQTGYIGVLAGNAKAQGVRDEEMQAWAREDRPMQLQMAQATLDQLLQGNAQAAQLFPEQLRAAMLNNEDKAFSNELQETLRQTTINTAVANATAAGANADIARAKATYAFDLAALEVALGTADVNLKKKQADAIVQQIEESKASIASQSLRDDLAVTESQNRQVESAVTLATKGAPPELLAEYVPKMLAGIVGEDQMDDLVAQLTDISTQKLTENEAVSKANVAVAFATADHAEAMADAQARKAMADADYSENWKSREDFDRWATEQGIAVQWGTLAARQSEATKAGGVAGATPSSVLRDAALATGFNGQDLAKLERDYKDLQNTLGTDMSLLDTALNGTNSQAKNAAANQLMQKYGMSVADIQQHLRPEWQTQLSNAELQVKNAILAVWSYGRDMGVMMTPQSMGIGDPVLFSNALEGDPDMAKLMEDIRTGGITVTGETQAQINSDILDNAYRMSPESLNLGGPSALYDSLSDKYGADTLRAMGIGAPADLSKQLTAAQQDFQQRLDPVQTTLRQMGYDIYDPEGRGDAQLKLAWVVKEANTLINDINNRGPEYNVNPELNMQLAARARDILAATPWGGMLPFQQVQHNPTTILQSLTGAITQANQTLADLQWLAPRVNSELMNALRGR